MFQHLDPPLFRVPWLVMCVGHTLGVHVVIPAVTLLGILRIIRKVVILIIPVMILGGTVCALARLVV